MSENSNPVFSGIGILGDESSYQVTNFDQAMNMKFNPTFRKCGPPPEHLYEAYKYNKERYQAVANLRQGDSRRPTQAYAIGTDGMLYPEVVIPKGQYVEKYAHSAIFDDPYQPYSYYTKYSNVGK